MAVNEAVVITVREDGALVVKRNLESMGAAGTTASKGIDAVKMALGTMTTSIRQVNPALTEMQRLIQTVTGVSGNLMKSARDSASAFREILTARDNVDALRASLDPAYGAQMRFNSAFDLLESALASGAIKTEQYSKTLELLIRDYNGADAAARELAATNAALTTKVDALRASYDPLFASSKRYEAALETLNQAQRAGIISAAQYDSMLENLGQQMLMTGNQAGAMGKGLGVASANSANLFAQFNDIGVMLAAGQNPIQLALQQGTQISQVLTMISVAGGGLRGMFSALAAGFMSLINPITLLTIGIIAFGAAAFQWIMKLIPETLTLEQRLEKMATAVSNYVDVATIASATTSELRNQFGSAGEQIGRTSQLLSDFLQTKAIDEMKSSISALSEEFGGFSRTALVSTSGGIMKEIEATYSDLREEFDLTDKSAAQLTLALEAMSLAATPTEAIAASERFNQILITIYGSASAVPVAFQNMAIAAGEVARQGGTILSTEEKIASARQRNLTLAMQQYAQSRTASNAALSEANAMIQTYNEQNRMLQLIAQYGEDSVQVAQARQAAERAVLQAQVDQLPVAANIKAQILASYDATNRTINATNAWSSAMAGVAVRINGIMSALSSLGGTVIANASRQVEINALRAGSTIAEARIAATKHEINTEMNAREMAAGNIFERGVVWLERAARLRGVDQAQEITELQAVAAERERLANAPASGESGGSAGGGTPKISESMELQNSLIERAIGRREEFTTKLNEVNALLADAASGYTKSDAFEALSSDIGAELFAGTQEALDAQVEKFRLMYEQIDMLRQADIISEQSAAMAKANVDAQYREFRLQGQSDLFKELAKLSSNGNRVLGAIGKAAAVTQATIDGYLAIQKALASQPPPMNYAMAAAIGVTTAANVASILSTNTNFATGGSFTMPGGMGGVDSQVVALRASPGERVTVQTPTQVRHGSVAAGAGDSQGAAPPQVNTRIINVIDPELMGDYLATAEGEQLLMNVIRKNGDQLRAMGR
jgi:hypothetical protein